MMAAPTSSSSDVTVDETTLMVTLRALAYPTRTRPGIIAVPPCSRVNGPTACLVPQAARRSVLRGGSPTVLDVDAQNKVATKYIQVSQSKIIVISQGNLVMPCVFVYAVITNDIC